MFCMMSEYNDHPIIAILHLMTSSCHSIIASDSSQRLPETFLERPITEFLFEDEDPDGPCYISAQYDWANYNDLTTTSP